MFILMPKKNCILNILRTIVVIKNYMKLSKKGVKIKTIK